MPSAYHTRRPRICQHCGVSFWNSANMSPARRYCSKRCAGIAREGTPRDRLLANITKSAGEDACWGWTGRVLPGPRSYGSLKVDGRETLAHRLMWELTHGPIPDGLCVCHRCDNPPCCNPAHLFLGTKNDNAKDAITKGRIPAKLTAEAVHAIRVSDETQTALALRFGVSQVTVSKVKLRKLWADID